WPDIMAVQGVEWDMLCSYVDLARKHACRWSKLPNNIKEHDTIYGQEAFLALRNSIYGYGREHILFSTYTTHCVVNHLTNIYASGGTGNSFSREDRNLLRKFNRLKNTLGAISFEELTERLSMTKEQS